MLTMHYMQPVRLLKKVLLPVAVLRSSARLKPLVDLKGDNDDENTGIQIIRRAIEEPLRQICENAGIEGSISSAKS